MNKLQKVGLTALATTLVSSAAFAGEMSVSGSASLNYSGLDTNSEVNPWTMGDSVTFSGGGDLDNGMTVNVSYELDGGNYDDYSLTLGLPGTLGSLAFSGASVNVGGVDKVKDMVPTAYTPVYENTNAVDNGLATTSGRSTTGMWGYNYNQGGLMVSLGYTQRNSTAGGDAESSIGVSFEAMDGLTIAAGTMDDGTQADNDTYAIKYTAGAFTGAYQATKVDYSALNGTADQDARHMGISYAVNENLSVSVGEQTVDITDAANDEENTGINASYTMGSITLGGGINKVENASGTAGSDAEVAMFNAALAF
jgi:outer membrane protein OmpU